MKEIKVCRICLVMDVNMYNLETEPLGTYFESIMGINAHCAVDLPSYACFECAALMKKHFLFKDKCLRGQATLYDIIQINGKITKKDIKQINRRKLKLSSKYSINEVPQDNIINYEHDENASLQIKTELILEDDKKLNTKDDIKLEDYLDDPPTLSSDEDEPLSLHKTIKSKKINKKEDKVKFEVVLLQTEDETSDQQLDFLDSLVLTPKPQRGPSKVTPKPKRGPSKLTPKRRTANTGGVILDDMDIEQYATVIRLTMEEQIEEINKRKESSNYLNAPFQCNLCYRGYIDTNTWMNHAEKHAPSAGNFQCAVCKFRFKTKRTLQKHAMNHETKYACKSCQYVSRTVTQAKQHQRWHKGVTYKCEHCDEVSTKWTSYLSHVRMKHPSDFICSVCGYSFVSKLGLSMHKSMMHKDIIFDKSEADPESTSYCKECDLKFVSEEAYKRHVVNSVKHTPTTTFNNGCRVCGQTFKDAEEVRIHHRKEHARKRPKNYGKKPSKIKWPAKCEHCPEEIANARDYWAHFRRNHPDKNYPIERNHICDICGKGFRGNAFLIYHKRTHTEEKSYKCSKCGKAFYNRTNLLTHEKTHSDVRPYPCSVCFKAFKVKSALERHFRCHTGVKPYECEVCGKAFGQSNSRKLHIMTVHLKQPAPYISKSRLQRRNNAQPLREQPQQFTY